MKQLEPKQEAKQIVDDYYNLMNQTFGGSRYSDAKRHAMDMMDIRINSEDIHPDEVQHWFEIKQEMLLL